jgi:large subunit ribosomal protein L17
MRHQRVINHLGRTSSHRKAMLANMANSLILHKRITTTTAKAKALRSYIEPLITRSKEDSTHSRRVVFSYLKDKAAVAELFREISPRIAERPGGYTRILKTGNRLGDNAEMCIMELVDYNENMLGGEAAKIKGGRRRRGAKKKSGAEEARKTRASREKDEHLKAVETKAVAEPETHIESVETFEAEAETAGESGSEETTEPEISDETGGEETPPRTGITDEPADEEKESE